MKKQTKKRILSILLCLVMAVGMLPTTAFAASEAFECSYCSNVYYGEDSSEFLCDDCGACGDCFAEMHCPECLTCYATADWWCEDCKKCIDCVLAYEDHCMNCLACYDGNEDELCGMCKQCDSCNYICPDCGFCEYCWSYGDDEMHCTICGECYSVVGAAECGGHHCEYCCSYCEQCGGSDTCTADDTSIEYCDECGLCVDCCMENREAFGCEVFCVESSEFEEHFCEECGTCWCDTYQCGYCGLCETCCANYSECSEGMCVEDSDYDDHFCPECDKCFHEADQCSECGLCEDCCQKELDEVKVSSCSGCANFTCVEQDGFAEHMNEYHSDKGYTHTHRFSKSWSMDNDYHWHACLSCENGKDATGSGKDGHTADPDTGICTVCGYKSGETMYFITQPEDAHVQVSESHYYGSYYWANPGPTNYWNNRTSFRVKAFSNGPLYYRWYQVKDGGEPTPLSDNKTDKGELYVSGAATPTLTISVSTDSCTSNYSYYCVITDGKPTTTPVKSAQAKMVASHRYSLAAYDKTTESGSIWLKTYYNGEEGWLNRAQTSTGHKWYCCGEGHGTAPETLNKKAKAHNWQFQGTEQGAYTKEALLANNCITFNKYRCTDCSYVKYVEDHTCDMEPKAYAEGHADVATKHQLVCKTAGCDKTGSALHNWVYVTEGEGYFPRQNPTDSNNGKVIRRCIECGYLDTNFTWKTAQVTKDPETGETTVGTKTELSWNTSNILVDVENGTANRPLVEPGDTVVLTPKLDGVHKFTGWTANYHYYADAESDEINVRIDLTGITKNADGTWSYTVPSNFFDTYPGGGELFFHGQYDMSGACDHEDCGTKLVGYKAAVCIYTGYSGDTVCAACGGLVTPGSVTAAPGTEHTGPLVPIEGEEKVDATCTKDGHEADTRCSACNHTVSGAVIPKTGHIRKLEHVTAPTCTEKGYSGDTVCSTCGKTLANGKEIPATGHSWNEGVPSERGKLTVITYHCTNEGCTATTTRVRRGEVLRGDTINSVNLTMTGYALGKTAGDVKVKPDENTAKKLTATLTGIYSGRPFTKNDEENINAKLSSGDEIEAEKTYYALVQLTANEGLKFNLAMSSKQVTLYNTQRAADLRIVKNPVSGENYYFAVFKLQPLYGTHTVIMVDGGTGASGAGEYKTRTTVTIDAGTKDGYTFIGWTSDDGVAFADATSASTTFRMPAKDVTVTANWVNNTPIVPIIPPVTPVTPVKPTEPETPTEPEAPAFPDVLPGIWYEDAVIWAVDEGITTGTPGGLFDPDGICTRAQAVTFLWRAAGSPAPQSTVMPFTDVKADSFGYDAVLWAVENGITKGTSDTTFSPDLACDRAQIVTLLHRFAQLIGKDVSVGEDTNILSYADAASIPNYAFAAMQWACGAKVLQGDGVNLMPAQTCTRAQIVTFIYRCMN